MANFLTVEEYFKKLGFVDGGEVLVRRAKFTPAEELLPKDGRDGKDGLEGPQGPSGKDGSDGKDGRDGRDGADGKDGVGLNWRGEYNPSEDYTPNDAVYYLGSSYVCVKDTRNNPPNQSKTYWNLLASAGAGGSNGRDALSEGLIATEVIYVTEAADLAGDLDSNKLYFIDGQIDMGTTSIVVPPTGLNIRGHGFGISGLYSTADNFDLFVTDGVNYSGDLFLTEMDLRISGASSRVFNLDNEENFNAVEWNTVNFIACTSLGEIANYRQGLNRNVAWISCKDGLTMTGNWSGGWAALDSLVVGAPMTGVLFRAGTGLTIGGSFRSNLNILGIGTSGGYFCDFSPSNITLDAGFLLDGVRGDPAVNNLPNMPASSTKALIKNCVGLSNTYPGAAHQPSADSLVSISAADTLYQITNAVSLSDDYWFSTANTNGIQLDSTQTVEVVASGTMSFTGSNNRMMAVQLRKWDDSASAYVNFGPEYKATLNGGASGLRAENLSFSGTTTLDQNDRVEVWIKNVTDTTDITVLAGGQFRVVER